MIRMFPKIRNFRLKEILKVIIRQKWRDSV